MIPCPRSATRATIAMGTRATSSCHGWRSSGDCVQRWRRTWIVTAAHRIAFSRSPRVPASSPDEPQSMTAGLSRTMRPPMPRTRPTSSLRRGRIPKNTASRTATQIGIVYTSTDERPAGTTCSARVISTTPAAICARPTESTIGMFERSGSRQPTLPGEDRDDRREAGQHAQRGVGERRHVVEADLDDDPVQAPHERQERQQDERGGARVDGGDRLVGRGGDRRGGLGGDPVGGRAAACVLRRLRGGLGHPRGAGLASGLGRTMSRTVPIRSW